MNVSITDQLAGYLTDLTSEQLDGIRQRVRAGIESIEAGKFVQYEGREGLKKLADGVKGRGRKLLARRAELVGTRGKG